MFTIAEYDIERIGRSGMGSINCKVNGFWSGSTITLYIDRRFAAANGSAKAAWKITLSNSSGGRDTDEVASDMVAYKNYAAAMTAMADLGLELESRVEELDAHYNVQRAADKAQWEADKAAAAAAVEADTPLGTETAEFLVNSIAVTNSHIKAFRRGEDRPVMVTVSIRAKTKYYLGGSIVSKKDLVAQLAQFSARTDIHTN